MAENHTHVSLPTHSLNGGGKLGEIRLAADAANAAVASNDMSSLGILDPSSNDEEEEDDEEEDEEEDMVGEHTEEEVEVDSNELEVDDRFDIAATRLDKSCNDISYPCTVTEEDDRAICILNRCRTEWLLSSEVNEVSTNCINNFLRSSIDFIDSC